MRCAVAMSVELEQSYNIKYGDKQGRISHNEMVKIGDTHFVKLTTFCVAKLCFGTQLPRWAKRSHGLQHLYKIRNDAAFNKLSQEAAEFADDMTRDTASDSMRKRKRRGELISERAMDKDVLIIDAPSVTLPNGEEIGKHTLAMVRPIQPADALYCRVHTDHTSDLEYVLGVIEHMGLADNDILKEELPKGAYWQGNRYVFCWLDQAGTKCYMTFRPTKLSPEARDAAKGELIRFAEEPTRLGRGGELPVHGDEVEA